MYVCIYIYIYIYTYHEAADSAAAVSAPRKTKPAGQLAIIYTVVITAI